MRKGQCQELGQFINSLYNLAYAWSPAKMLVDLQLLVYQYLLVLGRPTGYYYGRLIRDQ